MSTGRIQTTIDAAVTAGRSDREPFATIDWVLFVTIGLIWGSSFLLIKLGLEAFHPGLVTWARVALGAGALMAVPSARIRMDRQDLGRLVQLSIIWVGIPFTLFPLAEEHINSAVTGLLNGATPFFAAIFGALLFGRVIGRAQRWGILVGFGGIALVSIGSSAQGGSAIIGVVMVLVATMCYGYAPNLAGTLQRKYGSVAVMGQMLVLGTLWTAPFGVVGLVRSDFAWKSVVAVSVLGLVGTGFAFVLMGMLVGRVGGPRATFITYLMPIVSLALGAVFLSERVVPVALLGVALVLSGAVLASRREH
ncbi:MAG: DMT family transporter [Actinomycetota bacterium]